MSIVTVIKDPDAMNDGPAAVRIAYKTEASFFRVNTPNTSVLDDIDAAIEEFSDAFPAHAWRFDGKGTVRNLRRLGQLVDDVRFQEILDNVTLKSKMEAILGLV